MEPRIFSTLGEVGAGRDIEPKPLGTFDNLTESLRNTTGFASGVAHDLEILADRLFGPIPQAVESASKDAPAHSQVSAAQDQAAALHRQVMRIDEAVGRLSSL